MTLVLRALRRRTGRGQALPEFAFVAPIIVLLLFGLLDLGRAVYAYNTVAQAARAGARVAAVNQLPDSPICDPNRPLSSTNPQWSVRRCAVEAAISLGIDITQVSATYGCRQIGCVATVTVTYPYTLMTPIIGDLVGTIQIASTSQMQIESVFP